MDKEVAFSNRAASKHVFFQAKSTGPFYELALCMARSIQQLLMRYDDLDGTCQHGPAVWSDRLCIH